MPVSREEKEFVSYVVELMQVIGPVIARGMFGGHGLFLNGLMFALIADSVLYLKVDQDSSKAFKSRGLEPFSYNKKGKEYRMSYYQAPEEVFEDQDEMTTWANRAYSAAVHAADS